jgi:hypothetical protein
MILEFDKLFSPPIATFLPAGFTCFFVIDDHTLIALIPSLRPSRTPSAPELRLPKTRADYSATGNAIDPMRALLGREYHHRRKSGKISYRSPDGTFPLQYAADCALSPASRLPSPRPFRPLISPSVLTEKHVPCQIL